MLASQEQPPYDMLGWHMGYLREISSTTQDMSALDTAAVVDRVLSAVGWNSIDPRAVSRRVDPAGDRVRMLLSAGDRPKIALTVFSLRETLPGAAPEPAAREPKTDWIAATNGLTWKIWKAGALENPFREIVALDCAANQAVAAYFGHDSHANRMVDQIWTDETLGAAIAAVLKQHLAGSDELVALIKRDLERDRKISAEPDAIAECLHRLDVRVISARGESHEQETAHTARLQEFSETDKAAPVRAKPNRATGEGKRLRVSSELEPGRWPEGATHILSRKGYASFIRYSRRTGRAVILPGSVMRIRTKSSFPKHHRKLRDQAVAGGFFVPDGDILRVVAPLQVDTPSTAATLVTGTVSNGWTSWRNQVGQLIQRPPGAVKNNRGKVEGSIQNGSSGDKAIGDREGGESNAELPGAA